MLPLQTPFPFAQSKVDAQNFWPADEKKHRVKNKCPMIAYTNKCTVI